jgi:hypothetical protein
MKNESLIIEGSDRGISSVTVRVRRDHRERGIALLQKAMPSLDQLDQALRAQSDIKAAVEPRRERV